MHFATDILAQYAQQTGGFPLLYIVILGATMIASMLISGMLKSRFREYSNIPINLTGAQVAEMMLRQNGIDDVKVMSVPGQLTDHYDPTKTAASANSATLTAASISAAVSTGITFTPWGGGTLAGPVTKLTLAPRSRSAAASAVPCAPDERLAI